MENHISTTFRFADGEVDIGAWDKTSFLAEPTSSLPWRDAQTNKHNNKKNTTGKISNHKQATDILVEKQLPVVTYLS